MEDLGMRKKGTPRTLVGSRSVTADPVPQLHLPAAGQFGGCREQEEMQRSTGYSSRRRGQRGSLGSKSVRGRQRWDINNNVNVKTNVKDVAVLSFPDYVEHFKT